MEVEEINKRLIKVSVCQSCNCWVRASSLEYFQTNTKARNEFMREVSKHNLSVKEMTVGEFHSNYSEICKCN